MAQQQTTRDVFIVDGSRTPFLKAAGQPGPFSASDLSLQTARSLLARQSFEADALDEVITGCVMPSPDEANISRIIALRLGCGNKVPAWTVQRNCASGMQALDNAAQDIRSGRAELVLAGGCDAMSRAPVLFNNAMVKWLGSWMTSKTIGQKLGVLAKIRPNFLVPVIALIRGLTDPVVGLNMGQTAENVAYRFGITREQMDEYALESHRRLAHAIDENAMTEISDIFDYHGNVFGDDTGLRRDSSMERLAKLKPFFDKKYGTVTAGNSSQVTDGAAFLILASEQAIKTHNLPVMARIVDANWAALDPAQMGLGPVHASTPLLQRQNLSLKDIDYWEINEAFAAQVLGCIEAWKDKEYCQQQLGLTDAFGEVDRKRLNVDGGAICIGHPIGASGARIVLHLANLLERKKAKRGVATLCVGGGQGGAMLIERA